MPRGWDEIEAAVNACVRDDLLPVDGHLLIEVLVKLLIDVFDDWHPTTGATQLITPPTHYTHTHTIGHC